MTNIVSSGALNSTQTKLKPISRQLQVFLFLFSSCAVKNVYDDDDDDDVTLFFQCLTLLLGRQKEHSVMRCWCGYLSGARCRLFAYGPADATASHNPIISCLAYQCCPGKETVKRV